MARKKKEIEVSVGRTGSRVEHVALEADATVEDALDAAGLDPKDTEEVRLNGQPADLDEELEDGDRVLLVKHISGGVATS